MISLWDPASSSTPLVCRRARPGRGAASLGARVALLAGLAAALALPAAALDARRPLGDYGVQAWVDDLPQATVSAVVQTRDGYIWAGTFEGLVRFDGVSFTTFDLAAITQSSSRGALA